MVSPTHCAFILDAVRPKVTGRELPPNDQGCPREHHLTRAQYPPISVVERKCAVDDIIRTDLRHQADPLLECVVPNMPDVARFGQTSGPRCVDVANLVY